MNEVDIDGYLAGVLPRELFRTWHDETYQAQAIIARTYDAVARHGRQPVALFGLAFKQGTDDLRESPFVLLAEKFLG